MREIEDFKKYLIKNNISGIALDIDETLSWTCKDWFEDMLKIFGNPENLTANQMARKYKLVQNVPYWKQEDIKDWVNNHINCHNTNKNLSLVENSLEYVNKLVNIIPVVAYITVRPKSLIEPTIYWLEKNGFPKATVIARPDEIEHSKGNEWKAKLIEDLYPNVLAIVDDNPKLVNSISNNYKGTIYLFDHDICPRNDINVIACKDWRCVYNNIKNDFKKSKK